MHEKRWLTLGSLLVTMAVLTGCGTRTFSSNRPVTHHHKPKSRSVGQASKKPKNPPIYKPKSTSIPIQGATFPTIIQMAMSHIKGLVASNAEAPTMVPWPSDGSTTLFYAPQIQGVGSSTPDLIERYQVTLSSSAKSPVASFASAVFSDPNAAKRHLYDILADKHLAYPPPGPGVEVGSGVTATSGVNGRENLMGWVEGGWSIVLGKTGHLPVALARVVAGYLNTHVIPTPESEGQGQGVIVVAAKPDGAVYAEVAWQEGRWLYSTATYPTTKNPATTALALAVSMRRYGK